MMSCILVFYLLLAAAARSGGAAGRRRRRRRSRCRTAIPTRSTRQREDLAKARAGRGDLGRSAAEEPAGLRVGVEAGARALLAGRARAGGRAQGAARSGHRGGPGRRRARAESPRRPLLDRRQHGRARRVVRHCARASSTAATSRTSCSLVLKLDPAFQHGSADRALGRWYFKVPGLFGGSQQEVGGAPAEVADLQPQQQRVALLPRRDADRHGPHGRGARRAAEGHRRPDRPRLGARRSRVQGEGARLLPTLK